MEKFDKWNEIKKATDNIKRKITIKPREIWWVKIGQNIGSEEYGKGEIFSRPVIAIRRLTKDLFIGIPITTNIKDNDYFQPISYFNKQDNKKVTNSAMLLQIRAFSIKRISSKIGVVSKDDFKLIEYKLKDMLFPPTK